MKTTIKTKKQSNEEENIKTIKREETVKQGETIKTVKIGEKCRRSNHSSTTIATAGRGTHLAAYNCYLIIGFKTYLAAYPATDEHQRNKAFHM